MSLSNPAYGTLPAFQRPASAGPSLDNGGFIPPPPGASQGGEPGQNPFQQSHPSPWLNTQPYQLQPQIQTMQPPWAYPQSQQSHQSLSQLQNHHQTQNPQQTHYQPQQIQNSPFIPHAPPIQHSPYRHHRQPTGQYQAQDSRQSDPTSISPWTYGQYPPSPDIPPLSAPATVPAFNEPPAPVARYSPYGVPLTHPPASAPAETAPWSQHLHPQQSNSQPPQNSPHASQSYRQRPQMHRQHSSFPGHIQYTEEEEEEHPRLVLPLPFRGSANAPPPKKSAMRRSNSQSAVDRSESQSHTPQMQRLASAGSRFGHGNSGWPPPVLPGVQIPPTAPVMPLLPPSKVPGYTLGDEDDYSSSNLSPRPRDWRADYSPKQGFSSYLPKIGRVRTDVEEYIDPVKRSMHPLLHHTPDSTPLAFDLRYKLMDGHTLLFHQLGRHFNEIDLAQFAAYPPVPMLRLYHPRLPWYVDVYQSHPSGVTVFDVLVQMSLQMQAPIHNRHYYNDSLDSDDRAVLGKRYKERVKGRSGEGRRGILQVDFLRDKFIFEGLIKGKQGMWEIKTRRADAG